MHARIHAYKHTHNIHTVDNSITLTFHLYETIIEWNNHFHCKDRNCINCSRVHVRIQCEYIRTATQSFLVRSIKWSKTYVANTKEQNWTYTASSNCSTKKDWNVSTIVPHTIHFQRSSHNTLTAIHLTSSLALSAPLGSLLFPPLVCSSSNG